MPSIEFDDDRPPRSRQELLATVRRDGLRRRYRRNGLVGSVALVLVSALAIPVIAGGDDGEQRKVAAIDQPTTTIDETTTTSVPEIVAETTTPVVVAPQPTAVPRTTTSLVCRNSTDARCGPFRWDPDPGSNEPATVQITWTPAEPHVDEQVTFHIRRSDPDGSVRSDSAEVRFGDGVESSIAGSRLPPPGGCAPGFFGPWTPPPRQPDTFASDWPTHAYKNAGTYTVEYEAPGDPGSCVEPATPYTGPVKGSATITISPAPA
ncbi:MAG: hypothetical protein QOG87_1327 [Actinomycetota bacterium]